MVQFNLLPDVKLEYVRARRTKTLMTVVALVVGAVSLAVMLFALSYVQVVQRKSLSDLDKDIKKYSRDVRGVQDLNKILTVQNQLKTLSGLHDAKPAASRLFGYLTQVIPEKAALSRLSVDYATGSMTIGGTAPSLEVVSTFTDTLKATTFTSDSVKTPKKAFSEVVLSSFGRDDNGATYTINFKFDPSLFKINEKPTLTIPNGTVTNQSNLFKAEN